MDLSPLSVLVIAHCAHYQFEMNEITTAKFSLNYSRIFIRVIGIYQIFGGLLGLFGILRLGLDILFHNLLAYFIIGFVFSFGLYSGVLLLKKKYNQGIKWSLINQFFQLSQIKILGFGFEYVAGTYFAIGFSDEPTLSLQYYLADYKSTFFISYIKSDNEISVLINLIAVTIYIFLYTQYEKLNKE